ncbi:hypothetical protein [Streptomyces hirsutus]|uniref:hypothetical protein n=1 Tax=Streptomyces hirsutus TaxID=35620 RepID=UPI0033312090
MGWVAEDGRHAGYAVAVLADGRDATAEDNPGSGNPAWWCFDGQDGRPPAVGVRAGCDCYAANGSRVVKTWRGSTVHPVVLGDQEATEGPGEQGSPYAEWENTHVTPAAVPGDVTALLAEVRERLTALAEQRPLAALTAVARLEATAAAAAAAAGISAAAAAQQRGSSWTDIDKAVGTTKQAAHQRFARRLKPEVVVLDEAAHLTRTATPQTDLLGQQRAPVPGHGSEPTR